LRLFIAGKVSVARAIASALQGFDRVEGYFQTAQGDRVTWTGGHLLELADPEAYNPEYHRWRMEDLPIIPHSWQVIDRDKARGQLEVIRQLLNEVDEVVHAGDPDREGQWMVDEVLEYLQNTHNVQRLLIHDLNVNAIRKALQIFDKKPLNNNQFKSLAVSAMARSHADWLYGINMTRAYTLLGRHSGYDGVLSVGRVQTPLLAMVVRRDEAIEQFNPQTCFEMQVKFRNEAELSFLNATLPKAEFCYAEWKRSRELGLITDKNFYQPLQQKILGKPGVITLREEQHHALTPPLPLNLSALQIECALRFGYSASEVIECCQHLFEDHHLITYPRSDCRYLPESFADEVNEVLDTIGINLLFSDLCSRADSWRRSSCWDNKKIKSHHAIIPTARIFDINLLNEQQQKVYMLIARYYLAQFFGDKLSTETTLGFTVEGEEFLISGIKLGQSGWHEVIGGSDDSLSGKPDISRHELPPWQLGDRVMCEDVDIREKKTRPPWRFTDASLMAAMVSIAPYVESEEMQRHLQDLDGLGTESTRAFIIENLFKRGYLMKASKNIFSTPIGRDLVHALPKQAVQVDMTARWEKTLLQIADMDGLDAVQAADHFLHDVEEQITSFVEYARQKKNMVVTSADEVLGLVTEEKFHCPKCQSLLVQRSGKHGVFWGCSSYPECKGTVPDRMDKHGHHQPDFVVAMGGAKADTANFRQRNNLDKNCPDCGKVLVKRKGKRGVFAGCSGYPVCKHTEPLSDNNDSIQ